MAWELMIPFVLATLAFTVTPGPGAIFCAAQGLARGRNAGWQAALGLHIGGYVHVIAASAGLSALLAAVPGLYAALKLIGAAFLVWMGLRMLFQPVQGRPAQSEAGEAGVVRRAIVVAVANPVSAMFYLAFLPQFVAPAAGLPIWAQMLALGAVVNLVFSLSDLAYGLGSGALGARAQAHRGVQRWLERAAGVVLVGLGLRLALDRSA